MISRRYKYKLVENWEELHQLVAYCKQTGYASSDYETWGTNAMYPGSYPTLLGVSFQPGSAWIIPLAHKDSCFLNNNEWVEVLKYFGREVIQNDAIVKIGQNIQYEINWWRKYGIVMAGRVFDTMLAKYLLDEERPHGLKEMVDRFIPDYAGYNLVGAPGPKAPQERIIEFWSNVPLDELAEYCALDSDLTFRLWVFFERRLIDNGFYPFFRNMMMMASRVLSAASYRGLDTDRAYLRNLKATYAEKIKTCEVKLRNLPIILEYEAGKIIATKKKMVADLKEEIEQIDLEGGSERLVKSREAKISRYLAGDFTTKKELELIAPTNFNSTKQMIDLLFDSTDGFMFDIIRYTEDKKTKQISDRPSTDESVLLELQELDETEFIKILLELRGLTKMNSTYVVGMWEKLNSNDKIHGGFLLHGTVTGRLSSRNPNLQNIPRDTTSSDIKKMFIAPPGKLMMQLDYSQAELRVLAAEAKEHTMISWFKTGKDVHLASACLKYDEDYDMIKKIYDDKGNSEFEKWKIRRKQAKTINFGIVYGQTSKKLSITLSTEDHKVSIVEAQEFLDNFNEQFPAIAKHIKRQQRYVTKHGYVKNLFGRKRRLPNVDSDNWGKKAEALRQAVNAPIQGAASDFTLFSSILIREHIIGGTLPRSLEQVGTVHDSLIFYMDPADIHDTIPKLYDICRSPETKLWFNFEVKDVEMKVDFEMGKSWGGLKDYDPQVNYTEWVT